VKGDMYLKLLGGCISMYRTMTSNEFILKIIVPKFKKLSDRDKHTHKYIQTLEAKNRNRCGGPCL
jgi:hypothetical protein